LVHTRCKNDGVDRVLVADDLNEFGHAFRDFAGRGDLCDERSCVEVAGELRVLVARVAFSSRESSV
jgi:hypothetical protein